MYELMAMVDSYADDVYMDYLKPESPLIRPPLFIGLCGTRNRPRVTGKIHYIRIYRLFHKLILFGSRWPCRTNTDEVLSGLVQSTIYQR